MGLRQYHQRVAANYLWPERALVETITIFSDDKVKVDRVVKQAGKSSGGKLLRKFNRDAEWVRSQTRTVEREELDKVLPWKAKAMTEPQWDESRRAYVITKIEEIIPPKPKTIDEARGYIIADYQDHLEKLWVQELSQEFEVKVHQDVLSSIIRE